MKEIFILFLSLLAVFWYFPEPSMADIWSNRHNLRNKLMKNYNKKVSPHGGQNGTTTVIFNMFLKEVLLDEETQVFTASGWLVMVWKDKRLSWDPKDFEDERVIHFELEDLWRPDLLAINAAAGTETNQFGKIQLYAVNNGRIVWVAPASLSVPCTLNLKFWPFDIHKCEVILISGTHDGFEVNLLLFGNRTDIYIGDFRKEHMWKVLEGKMMRAYTNVEEEGKEYFHNLHLLFTIKRNSPMYAPFVIVPALGIPLFLMIQFLLPVDHPKRLMIGFVASLLATMELLFLKFSLPKLGTNVPLIVSYYSECFMVVILTVILSAILGRLTHPTNPLLDFPPPQIVKTIVTGPLATVLRVQLHASKVGLSGKTTEDVESLSNKLPDYSHEWLLVAKVVDRICSILFLCTFLLSLFIFIAPVH